MPGPERSPHPLSDMISTTVVLFSTSRCSHGLLHSPGVKQHRPACFHLQHEAGSHPVSSTSKHWASPNSITCTAPTHAAHNIIASIPSLHRQYHVGTSTPAPPLPTPQPLPCLLAEVCFLHPTPPPAPSHHVSPPHDISHLPTLPFTGKPSIARNFFSSTFFDTPRNA